MMVLLLWWLGTSAWVAAADNALGEPSWSRGVVLSGEARAVKNQTPILEREYRPLHIYGNTVRRLYYRGAARPTISDGFQAIKTTISRPRVDDSATREGPAPQP